MRLELTSIQWTSLQLAVIFMNQNQKWIKYTYIECQECQMYVAARLSFNCPITIGIVIVVVIGKFGMWIEMLDTCRCLEMSTTGRRMCCGETLTLNARIRFKYHKHFVRWCADGMRQLRTTIFAQRKAVHRISIVNCHIIVCALLMRLNFERIEMQSDSMARRGGKMPYAI